MRSSCSEETILEEIQCFHGEIPVPMSMGLCPLTELSSLYSMIDEDLMEGEGLEQKGGSRNDIWRYLDMVGVLVAQVFDGYVINLDVLQDNTTLAHQHLIFNKVYCSDMVQGVGGQVELLQ